jgi:hypothetical protein
MPTTIVLPESLEAQLQQQAAAQEQSLEEWVLRLLRDAVAVYAPPPSLHDVVTRIKATPPASSSVQPARGSLENALRVLALHPSDDAQQWNTEWAVVEAELRAMTDADGVRDGHGL